MMDIRTKIMINHPSLLPMLIFSTVLVMVLAGCTGASSSSDNGANSSKGGSDFEGDVDGEGAPRNESDSDQAPEWPPLESAPIRPGVSAGNTAGGTCTANFVFWDSVNDTVYMGTAAHCVDDLRIGDRYTFHEGGEFGQVPVFPVDHGATANGNLVYSGWWTGSDHERAHGQDFALIAIDEEDRDKVHPKILYYGGPTGLATKSEVEVLDRVLWHNSGRKDFKPLQPNEAYVCALGSDSDDPWKFTGGGPVLGGDSGSPVLVAENGMALGVLTGIFPIGCVAPAGGGPWLYKALDEANNRGMNVELATWPLDDDGELPDLPV